jgi:hypothetical protein
MQNQLFCSTISEEMRENFSTKFDRLPFAFEHALTTQAAFEWPALCDLAARRARQPNSFYMELGATEAGAKWKPGTTDLPVEEALRHFAANDPESMLWVMLKRVQEDDVYKSLLQGWVLELSELLGYSMLDFYRDPVMTVLITSPGRITPCHCDGEANLLLQIRGSKTVWIADGDDRAIVSEEALERFWSGDLQPVNLTSVMTEKAWRYELTPGIGVTNPVVFPHWVENGNEVSVSLSLNFKRRADRVANAHKVNRQLRRLGLKPKSPGKSMLLDETKSRLYEGALALKRSVRGRARS